MTNPATAAATLFVRRNCSVMAHVGDQALEVQLDPGKFVHLAESMLMVALPYVRPEELIELAQALLASALDEARRRAAARTGALQAIDTARVQPSPETTNVQAPTSQHSD